MSRHITVLILVIFIIGLIISFSDWQEGIHISQLGSDDTVSAALLHRCYSLCRAVWRERSQWLDTGWELNYISHPPTNSLALAVEDEGVLYISFRSTGDLEDTRQNMKFSLVPLFYSSDASLKAHRGIQEKYKGLRDELIQHIENFQGREVILTGHSSGGMTALTAYLDIIQTFPDHDIRAVTFGAPRTVNRAAASLINQQKDRVIRVVMGKDVYALIPPTVLGYRHAGRLIRIGERSWWKPFSFHDHYPGYQQELENLHH